MEALLQHLKSYGMTDLSFVIVNAKAPHSMVMIHKLQEQVSFPVVQETKEEEVWNTMKGGKDDMFVYDRCGRLAYYIPFPLSVIHEDQPIVQAAILSTYFQSPCGVSCSKENSSFANNALDEEIPEGAIQHPNRTNEVTDVEDGFSTFENATTLYELDASTDNNTDYYDAYANFTIDTNDTVDAEQITVAENKQKTTTNVQSARRQSLLTSLLRFIWGSSKANNGSEAIEDITRGSRNQSEEIFSEQDPEPSGEETNLPDRKSLASQHIRPAVEGIMHNHSSEEEGNQTSEPRGGACMGVDEHICEEWSKRRLLQAQKCCVSLTDISNGEESSQKTRIHRACRNFGKKRCTKMQPVLKCCLKTGLTLPEDEEPLKEDEKM